MRARLCLALTAVVALLATPGAQDSSTLIHLDMHAALDGKPVQDLAISDVDVSEDGTAQKIETFQHVSAPARSFVVFLDTAHMRFEGARDVRLPLVRFLDRLLDDDDIVGVMTPDMTPADIQFGDKASAISGIMRDEATWE